MKRKPAEQLWLPFRVAGERLPLGTEGERLIATTQMMEAVVAPANVELALRQVERNQGSPGVDGMTVKELRPYVRAHWAEIRSMLLWGAYCPQPVLRVEIPKSGGGTRGLGIPTVVDRLLQQMVLQVLQPQWDPTFSEWSYGFRPERSAIQAICRAQECLKQGYLWVVDIDLEKFFDRVCHGKLLGEIRKRVQDERVVKLIERFLKAGVLEDGALHERTVGTPQGGPLSPLLANLVLDALDKELERRGHRFARYADDCNIYVRSRRAGKRVMASLTRFLAIRLKLKVNESKSAVARPWERKFLGYTFSGRLNRKVSPQAVDRFKARVREITSRTRGRSLRSVVGEVGRYLQGWVGYYRFTEVRQQFKELSSWIRRKLRCYAWKQWGRGGYRALRQRGVSRDLAWNTAKSAHGPWRLSRSPALSIALPGKYFESLGLPSLCVEAI
jgi:RNA-directed DNA polymerase